MRSIQISTPVFAAIWAARSDGEDNEDAILARMLKIALPKSAPSVLLPQGNSGFSDPRFGLDLPEGFEIFRVFKNTEFRARADRGAWFLEADGRRYGSLSELSQAIGAPGENAWAGWLCRPNNGGPPVTIGSLRDPISIRRRRR